MMAPSLRLNSLMFWNLALAILLFAGCNKSMVISDVNYSQPIETVLTPNDQGVVDDVQHGLTFNILPLQYAETQDSSAVTTNEVRMIRGSEGFYYITASGYSNVYVMSPEKSSLKLVKKIKINEEGLAEPAFNQRSSYIQLLNRQTNEAYTLTNEGLQQPESKENEETQEGGS